MISSQRLDLGLNWDSSQSPETTPAEKPREPARVFAWLSPDANRRLIAFSTTVTGRLTLWAVFTFLYWWFERSHLSRTLLISIPVLIITFAPRKKVALIAFFSWIYTYLDGLKAMAPEGEISLSFIKSAWMKGIALTGTTAAFSIAYLLLSYRFSRFSLFRKPIVAWFLLYFGVVLVATELPAGGISVAMWHFISQLSNFSIFVVLVILARKTPNAPSFATQIGLFRPFWGTGLIPTPKGPAYYLPLGAKDGYTLAVAQLKGIKLVFWACVIVFTDQAINVMFYAKPATRSLSWLPHFHPVPNIFEAVALQLSGHGLSWGGNWFAVAIFGFHGLLLNAYFTHIIVGVCRMCGFNVFRNLYSPLTARTVNELYNRFNYYYKEVLADVFYYPTFFKFFKKRPKLRLFAASFAAAGFGQVVFQLTWKWDMFRATGFFASLHGFRTRVFYYVIIGTGVGLSQIRGFGRKHRPAWFPGVPLIILFYFVANCFTDYGEACHLTDRLLFVARLFFPFI